MFEYFSLGGLGAVAGYVAIKSAGMAAAGLVGQGAGMGAPAGPVGAAVGALAGLALYGLMHLF